MITGNIVDSSMSEIVHFGGKRQHMDSLRRSDNFGHGKIDSDYSSDPEALISPEVRFVERDEGGFDRASAKPTLLSQSA